MRDSEREDVKVSLVALADAFAVKLTPERMNGYLQIFQKYPLEPLRQAIRQCVVECERFPSVKKILEVMQHRAVGDNRPSRYVLAPSWQDDKGRWWTRKLNPGEMPEDRPGEYVTPGHAERAWPLIRRIHQAKPGQHAHLLAEIGEMHRDFPACGWDDTYHELASLWAEKGKL